MIGKALVALRAIAREPLLAMALAVAVVATGTAIYLAAQVIGADNREARLQERLADIELDLIEESTARQAAELQRSAAEAARRLAVAEAIAVAERAAEAERLLSDIYNAEDGDAPAPDIVLRTLERLRSR